MFLTDVYSPGVQCWYRPSSDVDWWQMALQHVRSR